MSEALWSLKWEKGELVLLDQTKLPGNISYIHCRESREVGEAISRLSVRGAPAIGVAAAYGMVLAFKEIKKEGLTGPSLKDAFHRAARELAAARPTAVNLSWAIREMVHTFDTLPEEEALAGLLKGQRPLKEKTRPSAAPWQTMGQTSLKGGKISAS